MRLAKTPAVFMWTLVWLVWFLGVSGGVQGGVISSVVVTPDPLRPRCQGFTAVAGEDAIRSARHEVHMVDLRRDGDDRMLRPVLAFAADGSGGLGRGGAGHHAFEPEPGSGAVVTCLVVRPHRSGTEARSRSRPPSRGRPASRWTLRPTRWCQEVASRPSLAAPSSLPGRCFVDLRRPASILRFTLTFTSNGPVSWSGPLQGNLPANLAPSPAHWSRSGRPHQPRWPE